MPHIWYLCFMYGDLLWPDLELEPSLISHIYSISTLPYILGVFGVSFGPKLIALWSRRLVTWKPLFWPLIWPWPDTWPHLENLGGALGSSHRELSNAASPVSLWPFVRELWRGAFNAPPPRKSRVAKYPATAGLKTGLHDDLFKILEAISPKPFAVVVNLCHYRLLGTREPYL